MQVLFLLFVLFLIAALMASHWQKPVRSAALVDFPAELLSTDEFSLLKPAGFYRDNAAPDTAFYSGNGAGMLGLIDGEMVKEELRCAGAVVSVTKGDALEAFQAAAKENAEVVVYEDIAAGPTLSQPPADRPLLNDQTGESQSLAHPILESPAASASSAIQLIDRSLMDRNLIDRNLMDRNLIDRSAPARPLGQRVLTLVVQKKFVHFTIETTHKVFVSRLYHKTYELRVSVLLPEKDKYAEDIDRIIKSFRII